jgi:hypothetical protein
METELKSNLWNLDNIFTNYENDEVKEYFEGLDYSNMKPNEEMKQFNPSGKF